MPQVPHLARGCGGGLPVRRLALLTHVAQSLDSRYPDARDPDSHDPDSHDPDSHDPDSRDPDSHHPDSDGRAGQAYEIVRPWPGCY